MDNKVDGINDLKKKVLDFEGGKHSVGSYRSKKAAKIKS